MIIAIAVYPVFFNILGGIGIIVKSGNENASRGVILIVSSVLLIGGGVLAILRKNIASAICTAAGTVAAVYVIRAISLIANTDKLIMRHLPTVAVPVLAAVILLLNYLDPDAVRKRAEKKRAKLENENRELTADEKIV